MCARYLVGPKRGVILFFNISWSLSHRGDMHGHTLNYYISMYYIFY